MTRVLLQDNGVGVSVSVADRLAEMNGPYEGRVYTALDNLLVGAALLGMLAAMILVWAA